MDYRTLGNTGAKVSALGFGGSPLGGAFGPTDADEAARAVRLALSLGVNFFDVSPYYGLTKAESVLGAALKGVPRESYFLTTKVGRYHHTEFDFSPERVTRSVEESLSRLGTDYADLILCHDVEYVPLDPIIGETLPALRRLQGQGKVRFVGVSGYPLRIFEYISERAPLDAILSYCRCNLQNRDLTRLLPDMSKKGVGVANAAPLAMGLLSENGPPPWHPAAPEIKVACAEAAEICRAAGADIAQIALQTASAVPGIAVTLIGMGDEATVRRNVAALSAPRNAEIEARIETILAPVRDRIWKSGLPGNNDIQSSAPERIE